jgi:uncharacterized protein YjbI with pentapeptide repeats
MGRKDKPISLKDGENTQIGQLMRHARQGKGRTLSAMALQLGYTKGYLSMIENGHKQPSYDIVDSYEKLLEIEGGLISQMFQTLYGSEKVEIALEQLSLAVNHLDILHQGISIWNQWREEHLDIRPSLDRTNLEMANLSGANLNSADLTLARLVNANLKDADLSDAVLRQALLIEVNLISANLHRVYLSDANLSGANLSGANLSDANLSDANLSDANLSGANLSGANLSGANLSGANLSGANLSHANLSSANLSGADLKGACLEVSNLTETNLTGSNLDSVDLSRSTMINTIFGNVDLRRVVGLESIKHNGPSTIGIDTLYKSEGDIPEVFMLGIGAPVTFIDYMHALTRKPIEYYSCFLSYSSKNQDFAERLYADLQTNNIRCWYAPEDLYIGDKFPTRIDEAIRVHDKLLLVLSEDSINSHWVGSEVEVALEKERSQNKLILFPIKLDNGIMQTDQSWAIDIRRIRHIADFSQWKHYASYQRELKRLLRSLHVDINSNVLHTRALVSEAAVVQWLENLDYRLEHNKELNVPDMFVTDKDGNNFGVEVKSYTSANSVKYVTMKLYQTLQNVKTKVDRFIVVNVFPDLNVARKASSLIASIEEKPSNVLSVEGYIQRNEFQPIK